MKLRVRLLTCAGISCATSNAHAGANLMCNQPSALQSDYGFVHASLSSQPLSLQHHIQTRKHVKGL